MPSLPDAVFVAADKLGIVVFQAKMPQVQGWNSERGNRALRRFCGHYWYLKGRSGRPETPDHGPFMSKSAAYADAIGKLEVMAHDDARIARVLRSNALITGGAYAA